MIFSRIVKMARMVIAIMLFSGRRIAKDCRALSVRYQRLARRANRNATTVATGCIAAYIGAIDK